MKNFFIDLFRYNQTVNDQLLEQVIAHAEGIPKRILDLCAHTQWAHLTWNNRMLSVDGVAVIWKEAEIRELPEMNKNNNSTSIGIIGNVGLDDRFTYRNSKGTAFENTFKDVLFHVINHGTYHRGQINAGLRAAGVEPVPVDYILFKR
jgi:uncharacterized damage-inducible protein DinB